jgi:hypothetical protein
VRDQELLPFVERNKVFPAALLSLRRGFSDDVWAIGHEEVAIGNKKTVVVSMCAFV